MNFYNMGLKASHPSMSRWYEWPFLRARFVAFYFHGNSAVFGFTQPFNTIAGTFAAFVFMILLMFFKKFTKEFYENFLLCSVFYVGFFFSLVPFILVPRCLFLYHYIIPLIFSCILFVAMADKLLPPRYGHFVLQIAQFFSLAAYIYWCPLSYATPTNVFARKWSKRWW